MIVGAGKSGTTTAYKILKQHPDIFLSDTKEAWFFQLLSNPNKEILNRIPHLPRDFDQYLDLFNDAKPGQIVGEVTPSYLQFPQYAIPNIKKYHPSPDELKIAIILREPIEKIISQYRFQVKKGMETLPINKALDPKTEQKRISDNSTSIGLQYLNSTLFFDQVKAYMENFQHVKVFLFDELKKNPEAFFKDMYEFIGVDVIFPENLNSKYNNSTTRRGKEKPVKVLSFSDRVKLELKKKIKGIQAKKFWEVSSESLNSKTKKHLQYHLEPQVENLEVLTGLDLKNWKKKYE